MPDKVEQAIPLVFSSKKTLRHQIELNGSQGTYIVLDLKTTNVASFPVVVRVDKSGSESYQSLKSSIVGRMGEMTGGVTIAVQSGKQAWISFEPVDYKDGTTFSTTVRASATLAKTKDIRNFRFDGFSKVERVVYKERDTWSKTIQEARVSYKNYLEKRAAARAAAREEAAAAQKKQQAAAQKKQQAGADAAVQPPKEAKAAAVPAKAATASSLSAK